MNHAACCPALWYPANGPGARPLRSDAVLLTFSEREVAAAEGAAMDRMRIARGLPHMGGRHVEGTELANRTLGALGEIGAARVLGEPFDPKPFGLDVGPYNVRSAGRFHYGLPIRAYDVRSHPSTPYILATFDGSASVAILRGWITPTEATRDQWRRIYGTFGLEAWYVPQAALHDMHRLMAR